MIAKISATENLGGALGYNFKKVKKGEANILLAAELYQSKEGRYTMEDVLADALERKYSLIPSSKVTDREMEVSKIDTTKGNIKKQVAETLRSVLKHYEFCSLGELNAILSVYNLAVEEVKTEFRRKKYDGLVYVPTDDKGGKISTPIHASDIGRGVGYTAVQNRMQKSKLAVKPLVPAIRNKVLQTMRTSPRTEEELRQRLGEQGLRVVIRKNESGRIYGITFIDDKEGVALNGSRLGKGYAANIFNGYFSNPTDNPFLDETLYGNPSVRLEASPTVQPLQSDTEEGNNLVDELIEDIVGDTFATTGNDDWKEAVWQRKLRRQSKVKLRRRKH